jgi:hypothetical protein
MGICCSLFAETRHNHIASNQNMPHRLKFCGPFLLATCLAAPLHAQIHKVAPPEKVTRAIAVYEYTGDDIAKPTAARIVPVTLFINGHLEDAGVYLTRPMPMALQTGVVYSLEQAGKPEGTVDLDYARNILPPGSTADVAAIGAWYGYGAYAPLPKPKPSTLKASAKIAPIDGALPDDADDKPHFTGKQPGQPDTDPTPTATSKNPAPPDDPDRPTLHRADATPAPTGTGTVPDDDPDRPTLRHRDPVPDQPKGKKQRQSDSTVIPVAGSLNDDPDRPTMQRGKPAGMTAAPELKTLAPDLHQIAAVSDAANREQHIFTREWETHTERAETLAKLQALAQPIVTKYETTYNLTTPDLDTTNPGAPGPDSRTRVSTASKSPATPISRRKIKPVPASTPPPILTDEQLTPYELTYGGLPTFVYTAQSPITTGGPIYITLVAQKLPSGEFQIALSNITDASHLDRTPWLRLIDAVDPDASHRADLLFELRAQTTRQFALYRLVTAHAEQQFITGTIQ